MTPINPKIGPCGCCNQIIQSYTVLYKILKACWNWQISNFKSWAYTHLVEYEICILPLELRSWMMHTSFYTRYPSNLQNSLMKCQFWFFFYLFVFVLLVLILCGTISNCYAWLSVVCFSLVSVVSAFFFRNCLFLHFCLQRTTCKKTCFGFCCFIFSFNICW